MPLIEAEYSLKISELIGLEDYRDAWKTYVDDNEAMAARASLRYSDIQETAAMALEAVRRRFQVVDAVHKALLKHGEAKIWPQNVDVWTTSMTGNEFYGLMNGIGKNFWKDRYFIYNDFLRGHTVKFTSEWTRANAGINSFRELRAAQSAQSVTPSLPL